MAILVALYEAPMHPYRMQQLIKERGKDRVINVQRRTSIYQTIAQLEKAGLIKVRETSRDENRPERTVYELTTEGQVTIVEWMREALSTPAQEFPEFPAAISFLPILLPDDALRQLERRAGALADMLADVNEAMADASRFLPRLVLLEDELLRTTLEAELNWVQALIQDLKSGALTWDHEQLRGFIPPEPDADTE
jgi:DNA-binding PadR family transcriptional regulator